MSSNTKDPSNNGVVLNIAQIIKSMMSSAAKAELGALYVNAREAIPQRQLMEEMGHPLPPTPMQTDKQYRAWSRHKSLATFSHGEPKQLTCHFTG
jgi:hypothetical protein